MKRIIIIIAFTLQLQVVLVFGQGSVSTGQPVAVNQNGVPLGNTLVTICTTNPYSGTCITPLTTYTDITLTYPCSGSFVKLNNASNPTITTGCSNPGYTDSLGNVVAFGATGVYWCQYSGSTFATSTQVCVFPGTGTGGTGTPGGLNTQIQVNVLGAFGGYSGLTFNPNTSVFAVPGALNAVGNISALSYTGTGSTASVIGYTQGPTSAGIPPCGIANTQCVQAPTIVTSGVETKNGTLTPGTFFLTGTSAAVQDNYSGSFGVVKVLNQTALISATTLCAATPLTACGQAGQYRISYNIWGSGTACSVVTAGNVQLLLTWIDENGTAHSNRPIPMWDDKTGGYIGQMNFNTSLVFEHGEGSYIISTNGSIIQYSVGYTACTTGTGTYNLRITTEQLQ